MNSMILNIGPQHPSTHGVLRLITELDGEKIVKCEPEIGYLHRGLEKLAENRTYLQYLPMIDRVDYLSGFFYSYLFCNAVETLSQIEIPKEISYIRILMMELNRISSHLLWLGCFLLDLGSISPIFYTFREREVIISYFEKITGQRMMYNYFTFGGVRHHNLHLADVKHIIKVISEKVEEYNELITNNPVFLSRTKNIGIISKNKAVNWGLTGVNSRASGVVNDYRLNMKIYDPFDFKVITQKDGDCFSRYLTRILEIKESLNIIKQCLYFLYSSNLPKIRNYKINKVPTGEVISKIEAPRGTSMCYIKSTGEATPYRVKWRTGSFYSTQILRHVLVGHTLADIMAIYGSLDVILPEVDR